MCWTPLTQANTNNVNKTRASYKQLEVKTKQDLYRERSTHFLQLFGNFPYRMLILKIVVRGLMLLNSGGSQKDIR